jgi:biopolymer transport protein ExbB/TolQ
MNISIWVLVALSALELFLLFLLLVFFARLRRSEGLLNTLQSNQERLLTRLKENAELEQEVVASFAERQEQLRRLDVQLETRSRELQRLLSQADEVRRSPQLLREIIQDGMRRGCGVAELARETGLSPDEVELILSQVKSAFRPNRA